MKPSEKLQRDVVVVPAGTVPSWRQRDEAEWIAWAAAGVHDVENQIEVDEL